MAETNSDRIRNRQPRALRPARNFKCLQVPHETRRSEEEKKIAMGSSSRNKNVASNKQAQTHTRASTLGSRRLKKKSQKSRSMMMTMMRTSTPALRVRSFVCKNFKNLSRRLRSVCAVARILISLLLFPPFFSSRPI